MGFKHFTQLATEYFQGSFGAAMQLEKGCATQSTPTCQLKAELHQQQSYTEHTTHAKSEDAANHLGALGTTSSFHCRKTTQTSRMTTNEFESSSKSENRTIYF